MLPKRRPPFDTRGDWILETTLVVGLLRQPLKSDYKKLIRRDGQVCILHRAMNTEIAKLVQGSVKLNVGFSTYIRIMRAQFSRTNDHVKCWEFNY